MPIIKSLWASVQGDPVFMRRVNGWFTIFWIAMIPVSVAFGLLSSVAYVSALSLWALVSGHWSAWQASRVEVEQAAEAKEREENPVEQRVVEKLVEETEINPAGQQPRGNATGNTTGNAATGPWDEILERLGRIESSIGSSHSNTADAEGVHQTSST